MTDGSEALSPGRAVAPLAGLRIVDLSTSLVMGWCGRLLAAAGAEVLLVEPRTGHPLRSAPPAGDPPIEAAALAHAGKRAVALNLEEARGIRYALDLVRRADAVIASEPADVLAAAGFGVEVLTGRRPRLVFIAATGDAAPPAALEAGARAFEAARDALLAPDQREGAQVEWFEAATLVTATPSASPPPHVEAAATLPRIGEHSFDVLRRVLNVTDDHLLYLYENGVIGPSDA